MNRHHNDSNSFFLFGKAFHRINELLNAKEKTYWLVFQEFSASFTPEQMLLLSISAYEWNRKYGAPFIIQTAKLCS
jgi:hypothetical protein